MLIALAGLVLDTAGVVDLGWASRTAWIPWLPVVVSAIAFVLNASSTSELEKRLWVPVTIVLLGSSLAVASVAASG